MKRKSTLILIAALVLAITIPVFAFAAGNGRNTDTSLSGTFGRGTSAVNQAAAVQQGEQLMLQDCDDAEDCDCEAQGTGLGADGEALHQNIRTEGNLYLNSGSVSGTQGYARAGRGVSLNTGSCPWTE